MSARPTFRLAPSIRRAIEDEIARLVDLLDASEPDADLEPTLGWTANGELGDRDDREGNLAGTASELEHDHADCGDAHAWSNDPDVPQEGHGWHFHFNGGRADRNELTAAA